MGYYDNVQRDYAINRSNNVPSMDASRFQSGGPSPVTNSGFGVPKGLFSTTPGTFGVAAGMFMPTGSDQQNDAIARAKKLGMPSARNPMTPPVRDPRAPLDLGQPQQMFDKKTGQSAGWFGADIRLSPYLQDGFSSSRSRSGLGLSSDDQQRDGLGL
jgi:hypothetical protein